MFCGEGEDGNILCNSRIEALPHRPRTISPLIGKAPRMAWNTLPYNLSKKLKEALGKMLRILCET